MASRPFPILCFMPERPTEAIQASGLIRRLSEEIPRAAFTVVAGPRSEPLFRDTPGLRGTIEHTAGGFGSGFKLWSQLRGRRWGLILDAVGHGASRYLSAERRAIRDADMPAEHGVVCAARLLKLDADPPAPHLFTSPETEALAADLTRGASPIIAVGAGGGWIGKRWPAERYAFVISQLTGERGPAPGARVMILSAAADRAAAEPIRRLVPASRLIDLTGQTDLLLAYACLKHARLFLGNATALAHLAAAAGCPTVSLFGPSDDALYSPWGDHAVVVRGPRTFEEVQRSDPQLSQPVCHMFDIPVDAVVRAATRLLRETDGATHPAHGSNL